MIVLFQPYEVDIRQLTGIVNLAVIFSFSFNYFAFEIVLTAEFNSFQINVAFHVETSYLICTVNVVEVILCCLLLNLE